MILDKISGKIPDSSGLFPTLFDKGGLFSKYIPMFVKNTFSLSWAERINEVVNKAFNISNSLGTKMSYLSTGGNVHTARELLNSEMVIAYIMNGRESVMYLFYPLLSDYLKDGDVPSNRKSTLLKQIKSDIATAEKIAKQDHVPSRRSIALDGVAYTRNTIKNVVLPYKF